MPSTAACTIGQLASAPATTVPRRSPTVFVAFMGFLRLRVIAYREYLGDAIPAVEIASASDLLQAVAASDAATSRQGGVRPSIASVRSIAPTVPQSLQPRPGARSNTRR